MRAKEARCYWRCLLDRWWGAVACTTETALHELCLMIVLCCVSCIGVSRLLRTALITRSLNQNKQAVPSTLCINMLFI